MLGTEVCISCLDLQAHGADCAETRKVRWHNRYSAAVARLVDSMPTDKKERHKGLWTYTLSRRHGNPTIYVSCIWCGAISDLHYPSINLDGYCGCCSVCPGCSRHNFYVLDGWDKSGTRGIGE